jgi:TIR domain
MGSILISYRRADSAAIAGRMYDRLVQEFTREAVFKDVDSIPLGVSFDGFIRSAIERTSVVLVLIGTSWLEARSRGRRRLDDPADYVRLEIETALEVGVPMVPILVRGAKMPTEHRLPPSIGELAKKNGQPVREDPDFHNDMQPSTAPITTARSRGAISLAQSNHPGANSCGGARMVQ